MVQEKGGTWIILGVEPRVKDQFGLHFVCREQGITLPENGRVTRVHFVIDSIGGNRSREEIEAFLRRCVERYQPTGASRTLARLARKRRIKLPPNLRVINLEALP